MPDLSDEWHQLVDAALRVMICVAAAVGLSDGHLPTNERTIIRVAALSLGLSEQSIYGALRDFGGGW